MHSTEGLIEVPPYSPTDIVGAKEVWDAGGRVYLCPIVPGPDGQKYSTSALEARLKELAKRNDETR